MKTLAQPDPRKVRARWRHRKGNRLLLVGNVLWHASPKGEYRELGTFTDDAAAAWATRREYVRIPTSSSLHSNDRGRLPESSRVVRYEGIKEVNFARYVEQAEGVRPCHLLRFGAQGTLTETTPFVIPASWVRELYGDVAYLRLLARHRRRARRAGVLDQPYENQTTKPA